MQIQQCIDDVMTPPPSESSASLPSGPESMMSSLQPTTHHHEHDEITTLPWSSSAASAARLLAAPPCHYCSHKENLRSVGSVRRRRHAPIIATSLLIVVWICGSISHGTTAYINLGEWYYRKSILNNNSPLLRGKSDIIIHMLSDGGSKPTTNESRMDNRRRLQPGRRDGDPVNTDEGSNGNENSPPGTSTAAAAAAAGGGNTGYGDYGSYMNSGGSSSNSFGSTEGSTATSNNLGTALANEGGSTSYGTGAAAADTYSSSFGSYGGGDSAPTSTNSANAAGGYGSSSSYSDNSYSGSSAAGGYSPSSTSSYGASSYDSGGSSYGASSYGASSYGGGSSYGSDTYSSAWGTGAAAGAASSSTGSKFNIPSFDVKISLLPAVFLLVLLTLMGMLVTAHQMEHAPEGTYANCCRVSLHTINCIYKLIYNLYHCRLSEIPQVVFASELEDDEYTDEEIERMRLRPGIERALDVEHRKALRKVGIEMNKIKVTPAKKDCVQSAENIQR